MTADVLVVGAGLVGATLATALARAGLAVVALDAEDPAWLLSAAYDGRAAAVSQASKRLFEALGVWGRMAPHAAPILDIRVSDGHSPLYLHYDHRDVGGAPFGYNVENLVTRRALLAALAAEAGATLLAPARIAMLTRDAAGAAAVLADGRRIRARLVVAADGRHSATRRAARIPVFGRPYPQDAIVCAVAHERPHHGVAHERFLPAGPFAVLPLPGTAAAAHRSGIIWTEAKARAGELMAVPEEEFLAALAVPFDGYLGRLGLAAPRARYPLSWMHARRYADLRLVLVGDAAHALHPIAGQGLNMGLRDAAALAEVLADAHRLGLDIGAGDVLGRYARWRRFDNTLMLAATDGLNRLFGNDVAPLRVLRDLGLGAVDRLKPLKRVFMRNAMGLAGDLPRLMRGEAL